MRQKTEEAHRFGGVVGLSRGGQLPGWGGGDRIRALLEAGKFVVRKEAVAKYGAGLLHALNNMRLPDVPRFATGGLVSRLVIPQVPTIAFAGGGPVSPQVESVVRWDLYAGGSQPVASITGPREQVRQFTNALKDARRGMR